MEMTGLKQRFALKNLRQQKQSLQRRSSLLNNICKYLGFVHKCGGFVKDLNVILYYVT